MAYIVDDPVLGHRLAFAEAADPDGSPVLHVEMWVRPGGGVTAHVHPTMEERFTVVSGTPEFLSGRSWWRAGPGRSAVVAPGERHAYRNRGTEVAHVRVEVRPPSSLQVFLTEVAELARQGAFTRHALPRSPRGLLAAVAVAERHREMTTLGFPMPPEPVQRVLFPPLARLAERRGYAAARASSTASSSPAPPTTASAAASSCAP